MDAICESDSAWSSLLYSILHDIPLNSLTDIIRGNHFVREMWPAQRYMCEMGLFRGASGVIQMPTGAGKTKSVSMAIYSAFCSGNVNLSVVIAPFRALCREISNDLKQDLSFDANIQISEISDLLQSDYLLEELLNPERKTVVVTTPEKFLYIIRQEESIIEDIGQIIFDEGHLFDDEERGAAYELLISSILKQINPLAQRILISAIIPNVGEINEWFTKGNGIAFSGQDISIVEKLPAVLRWEHHGDKNYCYLYYISKSDYRSYDFFVPRLIDIKPLQTKRNEKPRYFPSVDFSKGTMIESNDMAIACLLKIVPNDNVAVFCGRRDSANIPDEKRKRNFARSMISCEAYIDLQNEIYASDISEYSGDDLLAFVIKMISKYSSARYLHRMVNIDDVTEIAKMWISGNAYHEIHSIADFSEYKIIRRQREKTVSLEEIAGICDSDFGYSSSLIINSICEILKSQEDEGLNFDIAIENLQELAQKLKYGLPDQTDIFIYELGFNDRYLAQEKRKIIGLQFKKKDTKHAIKKFSKEITVFLSDYPSIYQSRLSAL